MKEKIKRLEPRAVRSMFLSPDQRELVLKLNELIERMNELEEHVAALRGEKKWAIHEPA